MEHAVTIHLYHSCPPELSHFTCIGPPLTGHLQASPWAPLKLVLCAIKATHWILKRLPALSWSFQDLPHEVTAVLPLPCGSLSPLYPLFLYILWVLAPLVYLFLVFPRLYPLAKLPACPSKARSSNASTVASPLPPLGSIISTFLTLGMVDPIHFQCYVFPVNPGQLSNPRLGVGNRGGGGSRALQWGP